MSSAAGKRDPGLSVKLPLHLLTFALFSSSNPQSRLFAHPNTTISNIARFREKEKSCALQATTH
jgi:hypothetical protein